MSSLKLTSEANSWDLTVDGSGNIAQIYDAEALAQDVACAVKTFLGEVYFDATVGVPYFQQVLGKAYSLPLLQALMNAAAMSVEGVVAAQTTITSYANRKVTGTIHFTDATGESHDVKL